jgi:hypothetical protein
MPCLQWDWISSSQATDATWSEDLPGPPHEVRRQGKDRRLKLEPNGPRRALIGV